MYGLAMISKNVVCRVLVRTIAAIQAWKLILSSPSSCSATGGASSLLASSNLTVSSFSVVMVTVRIRRSHATANSSKMEEETG